MEDILKWRTKKHILKKKHKQNTTKNIEFAELFARGGIDEHKQSFRAECQLPSCNTCINTQLNSFPVSLTFPLTATGLSMMACIPRMEDWGGLMMGVPIMEPNTPPLEIVNVPPSMSSIANSFDRALRRKKKRR